MIAMEPIPVIDAEGWQELLRKIERERPMACGSYKDRCLRRRVGVRMRAMGVHTIADYTRVLDATPAEWDKLMAALTINVTRFFRDATAFDALESVGYPLLRERFPDGIRAWSAGCSHGQEAYSLAIGLGEAIGVDTVSVHATDIDAESLTAASRGVYAEHALADVPLERRRRWFSAAAPAQVRASLQRMVRVERHDLLRDAIPSQHYHLIACRNVIIYFSRDAQQQLFSALYDALVPGGLLVLGKVETLVGPSREQFKALNLRERLFQRPLA